jgi:vitamin B12 transporter
MMVACAAFASSLNAQDLEESPLAAEDVERDAAEEDAAEDVEPVVEFPEQPDTEVIGRSFPADPLSGGEVVTPTRTPIAATSSGSSVTVISEQDIQLGQQQSVAEVLRQVEGLDVVRQGGPGGLTSVFMRGSNSQHTKVLLDGIPINDPSSATRGFDFSTLMVDNIERIEVVRGPQSTVYGSDAIGGVINILTKRGEGPLSVRASLMGGSYGTHNEGFNASGGNDKFYYSFGASYIDTDGISAASEALGNTEKDNYINATFSGRFGWTPSELLNVDYVARYVDADAKTDAFDFGTGLPFDAPGANLTEAFYQRIQLQSLAMDGLIRQRVGFNWTEYDRGDTSPFAFVPSFVGQTRELDYLADLVLLHNNVLTVGFNHQNEQAATGGMFGNPRVTQNLTGVFLQDQITLWDRWFTTVGVRWDEHSTAGDAFTYRATTLYKLPCLSGAFHGTLGTGFRAPSLAENLFQFGNPDLRPETSKGWDLGWRQEFCCGRVVVDATYFRNEFQDLIVFDLNAQSLENVGQASTSGVEVVALWEVSPCWTLSGTYTRTDTRNIDTGNELDRRPQDKATVGLTGYFLDRKADVRASLLYVGDRRDGTDPPTRSERRLDDYVTVNLAMAYRPRCRHEIFVRVDNLFDAHYQEVFGYGVPGISAYGGARLLW